MITSLDWTQLIGLTSSTVHSLLWIDTGRRIHVAETEIDQGNSAAITLSLLMLVLEFPNEKHRAAYEDMVEEWRQVETPTSPGKLFAGKDFDEFLSIVRREPGESDPAKVPAHLFFLTDTDSAKLFGAIQIRHHIDHPNLIETGGHIGYGICPSERRKGYATTMLALAIVEAKKIGLSRLLITCKDENVGSWKVIESNGGVFERTTVDEGQLARRYWIHVG